MWSLGCIMGELLSGDLLFPFYRVYGERAQLLKIFCLLGVPSEATWPGWHRLPGAGAGGSSQELKTPKP